MSYDRGQAAGITKIAPLTYAVASWREEGTTYRVCLKTESCSCQFNARTGTRCKHIGQASAYRFQQITEKARTLSQTELEALLPQYEAAQQLDIAVAIRSEIQARQQAQSRDAQLKAIFA